MRCTQCGFENRAGAKFCGRCGAKMGTAELPWQCLNCQHQNAATAEFCVQCGTPRPAAQPQPAPAVAVTPTAAAQPQQATQSTPIAGVPPVPPVNPAGAKDLFNSATRKLASYAGEDATLNLNLGNLFGQVFKKHTTEEAERIFIAGTADTTPSIAELSPEWGQPWLFSRVLMAFAAAFAVLYLVYYGFENVNAVGGTIMVSAFAVPFSGLIFFFELNAYHDLSIYRTMKIMFVGGAISFLVGLVFYDLFPGLDLARLPFSTTLVIGFIEETAKVVVAAYFINRLNTKYILNGILIGAAVGAGFAIFETMGYDYHFSATYSSLLTVAFQRAWTGIGSHLVWAAITGGALVAAKRNAKFSLNLLASPRFLAFYAIAIGLHAVWDWHVDFGLGDFKYILLIILGWVVVFSLIAAGLKELRRLQIQALPTPPQQ